MRLAIVSDIHGNLTAFEAVLADLRDMSPDLVLHGGDLADGGSRPAEIVDCVRDLGWPGVMGNADEMLVSPETLETFARQQSPQLQPLFSRVRDMAAASREALGEARLAWLGQLPRALVQDAIAIVHASPESLWRAPTAEASYAELESVYGSLGRPVAAFGHIHRPFVRRMPRLTVANTGSVGLSYDGDLRATYLLLDNAEPSIRRVEYDLKKELQALAQSQLPHAGWIARILESGSFQLP